MARPAVLALTGAMRSNVSEERILAIMSLAEFGPEAAAAIPALITALRETAATEKPVTGFIPANVWNDSETHRSVDRSRAGPDRAGHSLGRRGCGRHDRSPRFKIELHAPPRPSRL